MVISESVDTLRKSDWDSVVNPSQFFLRTDYLEVLEHSNPPHLRFRYVLLYREGRPVWAAYFQLIRLSNGMLMDVLKPLAHTQKYMGFLAGWREWLSKDSSELSLNVLISGNNFVSGEYGQAWASDIDPAQAFQWLAESVRILIRTERDQGLISLVLVKDYYDETLPPSKKLRRARYYDFLVEPEMIVTIEPDWHTFEDYLGAMSKKYRNRARTVRRKMETVQQENWDAETITANEDALYELYINVHNHAKFRLSVLPRSYFSAMKKQFGDQFCFRAYFIAGKLVGFRTSFRMNNALEAHFIGLDYSVNREYALYQAMLYDYVEEGIMLCCKRVYLGRTASEIKSTVGARAHHLTCYIRHRNSFSNQLIRPFIDYLQPSEWVPRNPFKEEEV